MPDPRYRYQVGCAGQFMLGMASSYDDMHEAIAACENGPAGCEVYDRETGHWIGPTSWEEIEEAKAVLAQRQAAASGTTEADHG